MYFFLNISTISALYQIINASTTLRPLNMNWDPILLFQIASVGMLFTWGWVNDDRISNFV